MKYEKENKILKRKIIGGTFDIRELTRLSLGKHWDTISVKKRNYIVSIIQATRNPKLYSKDLAEFIHYGASPRASIATLNCAKAYAWLKGDNYVLPEHIQEILTSVLRHRISISFRAQAEEVSRDAIIANLIKLVAIP